MTAREAAYVQCPAALRLPRVPTVSVELRLAPVLPLLLHWQRPHFRRHAAHEGRSGLAGPGGGDRVLAGRRVERAAGMLAAISVEGRVAGAERGVAEDAESRP